MKHQSRISITCLILGFVLQPLFCCKKAEVDRPGGDEPKIEFQVNNSLKQYFTVNAGTLATGTGTTLSFVATKDPSADNYFNIVFPGSVTPGTYSIGTTGTILFREGNTVLTNDLHQPFTLTISNVDGNNVTASFSGTLSGVTISNGKINSVRIN